MLVFSALTKSYFLDFCKGKKLIQESRLVFSKSQQCLHIHFIVISKGKFTADAMYVHLNAE